MQQVSKIHKIKKNHYHKCQSSSEQPQNEQPSQHPTLILQKSLQEVNIANMKSQLLDAPMKRLLNCDPRKICNLSEQKREALRAQYPELNQYYFLTQRQKNKYFHTLNYQYIQQTKVQKPAVAARKKSITLKRRFQIQPFKQDESCDHLKSRKSFIEDYTVKDKQNAKGLSRISKPT